MNMRNWAIFTAIGLHFISPQAHADVVLADTEFPISNWGFETVAIGAGGTSAASQVAGGNPGLARQLVNTINTTTQASIFGFSRYGTTTATRYEPAIQGAILSVDWAIQSRWISGFGGQGHSITLGVKQGQVIYFADYDITGSSGDWVSHGSLNLVASDFQPLTTGVPVDFSDAGAPLRFGFIVGNGANSNFTNTVIYDNFSVTIHNTPTPGSAGIATIGLLSALGRRRRTTSLR